MFNTKYKKIILTILATSIIEDLIFGAAFLGYFFK